MKRLSQYLLLLAALAVSSTAFAWTKSPYIKVTPVTTITVYGTIEGENTGGMISINYGSRFTAETIGPSDPVEIVFWSLFEAQVACGPVANRQTTSQSTDLVRVAAANAAVTSWSTPAERLLNAPGRQFRLIYADNGWQTFYIMSYGPIVSTAIVPGTFVAGNGIPNRGCQVAG